MADTRDAHQLDPSIEEVEDHQDKGHFDVVSGIKIGHAKVPKFLKATYAILAGWALYHALAGCHNPTHECTTSPGLAGAYQRLGEQELNSVLDNSRLLLSAEVTDENHDLVAQLNCFTTTVPIPS